MIHQAANDATVPRLDSLAVIVNILFARIEPLLIIHAPFKRVIAGVRNLLLVIKQAVCGLLHASLALAAIFFDIGMAFAFPFLRV